MMTEPIYGPAHLSFLKTQISRPLTVFVPPLRRQLPKRYVDEFWRDGSIRLSCFAQFAKHDGAGQRDTAEGHSFYVQNDREQDRSIGAYTMAGQNAYVLSFSSRSSLDPEFGDAALHVIEPIGFCAEIANMIPGCTSAMIGPCVYQPERTISGDGAAPTVQDLLVGDGSTDIDSNKLFGAISDLQGPLQYFLKTDKHEAQGEFRMIWETNAPVTDPMMIRLASLASSCRRE